MALNLITNRVQNDVNRRNTLANKGILNMTYPELQEFLQPSKGAYGYVDLNRVEGAILELQELARLYGYQIPGATKTDWNASDIPSVLEMNRYLNNVRNMRNAFPLISNTPEVPNSMSKLTFAAANDIEQIILNVERVLNGIIQSYYYSNEIYGGEI